MERSLLWSAFGLAVCGGLAALLANVSSLRSPGRILLRCWTPLAVAVVVFLGSLPSHPPFAEGHGLGWGFLIGTLAALLAYCSTVNSGSGIWQNSVRACAPAWFAIICLSVVTLTLRLVFIDAVSGSCFGWFSFAALMYRSSKQSDTCYQSDQTENQALLTGATFLTIISVAAGLGFLDASDYDAGTRWIAGSLVITTLLCLVITVVSGVVALARSGRKGGIWIAAISILLVSLAAGRGYQSLVTRTLDRHALVSAAILGFVAALAAWWVSAGSRNQSADSDIRWDRNALALFVAVAAVLAAVNRAGAFGGTMVAMMLWGGSTLRRTLCSESKTLSGGLNVAVVMATLVVLYRFYLARNTDSGSNVLDGEGTLLGLMAGALLPVAGASLAGIARNTLVRVVQGAFASLFVLASFATCYVVWNGGSGSSLMLGFCISAAIIGASESRVTDLRLLWALGCSLALCQWSHRFFALTELTRAQRTQFGMKAIVVISALFVVREIAGVIAARIEKSRPENLQIEESVQ